MELHRHAGRNDEVVDRGNVLVRINEEPSPIERHNLNLQRSGGRFERLGRIQVVRSDPRHSAQEQDHKRGNRPDNQFDSSCINQLWAILGSTIARPKPPGCQQAQQNHRDTDGQHDRGRVVEYDTLGASLTGLRGSSTPSAHEASSAQRQEMPRYRTQRPLGTATNREGLRSPGDAGVSDGLRRGAWAVSPLRGEVLVLSATCVTKAFAVR